MRDQDFFWDGVEAGKLLFQKCSDCGHLRQPPGPICPDCQSRKRSVHESCGRGLLRAWVVSKQPAEPDENPRIVALIELEEGVRTISSSQEADLAEVKPGLPVELCSRPSRPPSRRCSLPPALEDEYSSLSRLLGLRGIEIDAIKARIARFSVALPSWGSGIGVTCFARFPMPGDPTGTHESLEDCAVLLPQAIAHNIDCNRFGRAVASKGLMVWIYDGTNFPGQRAFSASLDRYLSRPGELPGDWRMLLEHELYEPAIYSTVISDRGRADRGPAAPLRQVRPDLYDRPVAHCGRSDRPSFPGKIDDCQKARNLCW